MHDRDADIASRKRALRRAVEARRQAQPDKDETSRRILDRALATGEYRAAATIALYVSARSEVRTAPYLPAVLASGKQVIVPYCLPDRLQLFRLESLDELAPGTWGILEPRPELRKVPSRHVGIEQVDLVFVPGVAFDRHGGRLGHGKAYFDKLLSGARPSTLLVALAFECQLVDQVPMAAHDVPMDLVVTEQAIYRGQRNQPAR